jgi:hypothetical protein
VVFPHWPFIGALTFLALENPDRRDILGYTEALTRELGQRRSRRSPPRIRLTRLGGAGGEEGAGRAHL